MEKIFTALILLQFFYTGAIAQLLAFPTAEGAGKYVTGGRGSISTAPKIFEVTTLTDDASSATTPGTLRYACTNNSPAAINRIIVFRVAGTIHLFATLTLNRANTTIAGQTAAGEGICIADYPVYIGADNMIIRYLRFRLGDKNQNKGMINGSGFDDAFGDNGSGRQHIILDHCTSGWSDDESLTIYKGDNITVQWCMITEPLNYSYHFETGDADFELHSFGGIWGGKHASFHHNLFAHLKGRGPRFDGIRNIAADSGDFRNNVIYNWGDYNTNGGEGGAYNIVNNYYKYGPSTPSTSTSGVNRRNMLLNPYKQTAPAIPYGQYYLTGNYCDNSLAVTNNNWLGAAFNSGSFNDSTASKVILPFNCININMQSATDAYQSVLANAGCFLPHRDTLDQRIVSDVINRTGKLIDVQGGYAHGTPYATSQSAWPVLVTGNAPVDTDHDGIPDAWEDQRGLNKNSNADFNNYTSTTGYSNVETYLNGDTIVAPGILNTCVGTKKITTSNSGNWLSANDSTYSDYLSPAYLASTDSMNVVAAILDNGALGDFNASYYTTSSPRYDPVTGKPLLNRNITITPVNPALIVSPVTVRIYFSNTEFNALKAADASIVSVNDLAILKAEGNVCGNAAPVSYSVIAPTATGVFGSFQTGYYLQFQTSIFSTFFIGGKTSFPLPLKLISFNAVLENKKVITKWIVENEINTKAFNVERSTDGVNFDAVGYVAAINKAGVNNYSFTDLNPLPGASFYRLKMIDADGRFTYSNYIAINSSSIKTLSIFPNPVLEQITIAYPKAKPGTRLQILSSDGKQISNQPLTAGTTENILNVSSMAKGVYAIIYTNGPNFLTIKFLKQ